MSAKNAVLLIIKQNNGIDYNSLINKVSGNYSSVNSARAALSRTLKDLSALGFVAKKSNKFYLTAKASALINSEMKNKLLLKLNNLVNSKKNYQDIDAIVEYLHTLIERSKEDPDLLKAARGSTEFFLSDLEEINKKLEAQTKHLGYLSKVFENQISSLRKLDFNDSLERELNGSTAKQLQQISSKLNLNDFTVFCNNKGFLAEISSRFDSKIKSNSVSIPVESIPEFIDVVRTRGQLDSALTTTIYLTPIKARLHSSKIFYQGHCLKLKQMVK